MSSLIIGISFLYSAALAYSGWIIAERGQIDASSRIWLGLGLAPLLLPRLMRYDALLIGPALIVLTQVARSVSTRFSGLISLITYITLAICLLMNFTSGSAQLLLITAVFPVMVLTLAVALIRTYGISRVGGVGSQSIKPDPDCPGAI